VGVSLAAFVGFVAASSWTSSGARARGARLERMQQSPQWGGAAREPRFVDPLPRTQASMLSMSQKFFFGGGANRQPEAPIPVEARSNNDFAAVPSDALRVTWLGHSTLIVEIDGKRLLLDPVWSERVSPVSWAGPKRFYPPPLPLAELPTIDAVLISHDHYDHLDHDTIKALASAHTAPFYVPLGIGAHLEAWGVPAARIVELDWWEERGLGELRLVATPARHFSGRSLVMSDRDATLWAGWAMIGPHHRAFYSGDTAMFPGFSEIGKRLGPFDVTMIESGAYNSMWRDVHLGPEQAVMAHQMLRGKHLLPVHWGLFDLALHSWTEPVERVLAAAQLHNVVVSTPAPGGQLDLAAHRAAATPHSLGAVANSGHRWWPALPWESAEAAPVVSSNLTGLVTLSAQH
jgi:L-ascorbate metabolism protein UlaG (beta-lactamase superfamily)